MLSVTGNTFVHSSGEPIVLQGSPYGITDLTINGNSIKDFGQNAGLYGHHAFLMDLNGSATACLIPPLCSTSTPKYYDASGVFFQNNTISQTTASPSDYAYYFD